MQHKRFFSLLIFFVVGVIWIELLKAGIPTPPPLPGGKNAPLVENPAHNPPPLPLSPAEKRKQELAIKLKRENEKSTLTRGLQAEIQKRKERRVLEEKKKATGFDPLKDERRNEIYFENQQIQRENELRQLRGQAPLPLLEMPENSEMTSAPQKRKRSWNPVHVFKKQKPNAPEE